MANDIMHSMLNLQNVLILLRPFFYSVFFSHAEKGFSIKTTICFPVLSNGQFLVCAAVIVS